MAFGLGVLGLSPNLFWTMSVSELMAAMRGRLGGAAQVPALSRAGLEEMMAAFPDRP